MTQKIIVVGHDSEALECAKRTAAKYGLEVVGNSDTEGINLNDPSGYGMLPERLFKTYAVPPTRAERRKANRLNRLK